MDPFHPIIYVRGYAMTPAEIAQTVSTPYMGFNLGATRVRQAWDGTVERHVFESPLIRLMKDHGYRDSYSNGSEITGRLPRRSVIIYRYYDEADRDFGSGKALSIPEAAQGLRDLIHRVQDQVCGDDTLQRERFRVHLVAHSMGGLVCRCFLQNDAISSRADRAMVGKVFTYATPHNGIVLAGLNVPSILGLWDINNFNRARMAEYLGLDGAPERVDTLDGKFDPQRFFCFVGTNHRDYEVALGLSRRLAGEMSDGLVQVGNATVQGAPRAFAFRSHSGPYGVVNSEEGYQNLVRFLFGDVRVDGILEVDDLPLPPSVQMAKDKGKQIRASYYFEATVSPRGALNYRLSERRRDTYCAVLRRYDELFHPDREGRAMPRWPRLFSVFLDTREVTAGRSLVFGLELAVSTTGYTIDNRFFADRHLEGEYLYRETLALRASRRGDGWVLHCVETNAHSSESRGRKAEQQDGAFVVAVESGRGFRGRLRLLVRDAQEQQGGPQAAS